MKAKSTLVTILFTTITCLTHVVHVNATDCAAKLVAVQTGPSTTCDGGNTHWWPLDSTSCHGWEAVAPNGEIHQNSATNMMCIDETTIVFVQYPGTLKCEGTGTQKTITFETCEQDIPPVLYSKGIDFECCKDPDGASCKTADPSVSVEGSTIYKDGELCDGSTSKTDYSSSEIAHRIPLSIFLLGYVAQILMI